MLQLLVFNWEVIVIFNRIEPLKLEEAKVISTWKYPNEYAIYNFEENEGTISELLNGDYFSYFDTNQSLIGYFCFGKSAQIPTDMPYTSENDKFTDIGLGLSPSLCGCGYGKEFMQNGMNYAKENLSAKELRLVVAKFNKRAIALYKNLGFIETANINHKFSGMEFMLMQCTL